MTVLCRSVIHTDFDWTFCVRSVQSNIYFSIVSHWMLGSNLFLFFFFEIYYSREDILLECVYIKRVALKTKKKPRKMVEQTQISFTRFVEWPLQLRLTQRSGGGNTPRKS